MINKYEEMSQAALRAMYQNIGRFGNVLYHCIPGRKQKPIATRYPSAELKTVVACTMKT